MSDTVVYLGLGANLGDRRENLRRALQTLDQREVRIAAVSPLYETPPWGVEDQPPFLNAAARALTDLEPLDLLERCKAVEREVGRLPGERWGPRAVDVDILFYGDLRIDEPDLEIPHPRILERAFVLVPLAEVLDTAMPVFGDDAANADLDSSAVVEVEGEDWWR
jgi:2-amino-4-hydroxy-6-hydroxymethyldihydropteridine diphosphokinase